MHSSALFQGQDFFPTLEKNFKLQINEQISTHINVMNIHENQEQDQAGETACVFIFEIWQIYCKGKQKHATFETRSLKKQACW